MDKKNRGNKYVLFGFIMPFFILIGIAILMQLAPFGGYSLLISDFNANYIEQIASFRRILLGEDSFFYTWSQIQGSTPYGFIHLSIFNLFTVFFEEELLPAYVTCIIILKISFAGSACSLYLKRVFMRNDISISMFGWCYALMGYIVAQHYHIMWLDHMIIVPIILYGIEKILKDSKKWGLLCGTLTVAFINNYYLSYMTGAFSFLYIIYRYFTMNSVINCRDLANRLKSFFISPIIALGLSAFYVVPALSMMQGRDGIFEGNDLRFFLRYEFSDIISKFFIGTFDTFLPGGIPFLYCGLLTVILVVLYFCNSYITYKKKVLAFTFLGFMILSLTINPLYVAWQGFKPPVYFEGRFSYLVSFLMIILAYQSYFYIQNVSVKVINNTFLAIGGGVLLFNRSNHNYITDKGLMFTLVFIIIYYVLLLYRKRDNVDKKKVTAIIACIVGAELAINSYLTFVNLDKVSKYPFVAEYNDIKTNLRDVTSTIMEADKDKYRIEFVNKRSMNDGIGIGFPSISHFDSVYNYDVKEAIGNLGISTGHNWVRYSGSTPIVDTLLNIKYVATEEDRYMGYEYLYEKGFNTVFKNPYAISIGFMVADHLNKIEEENNPIIVQSDLLNNMLGTKENIYFEELVPDKQEFINMDIFENKEENSDLEESITETIDSKTIYKKDHRQESKKIYEFISNKAGSYYMYISPLEDYNEWSGKEPLQIKVNGEEIIQEQKSIGSVYYLGEFKEKEDIKIEMILLNDAVEYESIDFYRFKGEEFIEASHKLMPGKLNITSHGHTFIEGDIDVEESMPYLYLSIPYDEGWKLRIDGAEYPIQKVYNGFLGAKLAPGNHKILLKYEPVGLKKGIIISNATMLLILLYINITKYNKKHKNTTI